MKVLMSFLPEDRTQTGIIRLEDQDSPAVVWGPVPCFGKADNAGAIDHGNPTRDMLLPYGDHPLGVYKVLGLVPSSGQEYYMYGPNGKFVLDPFSGPCLQAKANGRYGLLIHGGGRAHPYSHGFRPTFGCLRLDDEAMGQLVDLWRCDLFTIYECRSY